MSSLAYAAIWLFVFSIPWAILAATDGTAIITKVTGAVALICALLVCLISGRVRRLHPFHIAALLFVLTTGIGLVLFPKPQVPDKFYTFLQLLLAAWSMWQLAPDRGRQIGLLTGYVLGAYVGAVGTILQYVQERGKLVRYAAEGADPNDLAMTLALGIPMAWFLALDTRNALVRWISRGYMVVGVLAIGLTGSRGGLLATLVALMIVPLTLTQLTPNRRAMAILLLFLAGGVAVSYVPEQVVQRLATTTTEVEDLSIGGRLKLWVAGLKAFTQAPIMGHGPAGFKGAITEHLPTRPQVAHNSYISILVEEGLIGFILYVSMLFTVFRAILQTPLLQRRFSLVLLATLVVALTPLTWEDDKPVWFVLAALVGLANARVNPRDGRTVPGRWRSVPPAPSWAPRPWDQTRFPGAPVRRDRT
jgi:O-antigen ligase